MRPNSGTSLATTLAARRIVYPELIATGPQVLVIDVPPASRGRGLALGRYYPIIVETDVERDELEQYLQTPRTELAAPDLFDHRPSNLWRVRSPSCVSNRQRRPGHGYASWAGKTP